MHKEEEEDNKFDLVVQKRVDLIHVPKILKKKRKTKKFYATTRGPRPGIIIPDRFP